MTAHSFNIVMLLLLLTATAFTLLSSRKRSARDVLEDLVEGEGEETSVKAAERMAEFYLRDPLSSLGLLSREERKRYRLQERLFPLAGGVVFLGLRLLSGEGKMSTVLVVGGIGFAFGYLAARKQHAILQARYLRSLEYHLPIIMERLVMGVESGLDILSAVGRLLELERDAKAEQQRLYQSSEKLDPVTRLLEIVYRMSDAGVGFQEALHEVAENIPSAPLRHAFVHLAMAHKEGGELVVPLRELSDSTQLAFQEGVEEELARLPVKATIPLVLTFAGLVICFITTPLIQVIKMTAEASIR